ncbi:MAG: DNA-directed RNA polymerase subunit omega [Pseudobdellovibrionaceae bacterium]|nr:DNA-directed RNA polymerase subunit omega [Bdellovibrionales bacterium]USN47703.1 MAG: DNA-directed RNA polymerase subunit omega [Pseudobdellovibrionaceae bacterium]
MARVTVEDCLDNVHNRFALVLLVSKRAKQLLKGLPPTVKTKGNKYVVSALREVAAGKVAFRRPDESITPDQEVEADLNRY